MPQQKDGTLPTKIAVQYLPSPLILEFRVRCPSEFDLARIKIYQVGSQRRRAVRISTLQAELHAPMATFTED